MGEPNGSPFFLERGKMKNREIAELIKSYRLGFLTARELVAILEQKLYNKTYDEEGSQKG